MDEKLNTSAAKETTSEILDDKTASKDFADSQKKLRTRERRLRDFELFGLRALIFVIIVWVFFFFVIGLATMKGDDMYPRIDGGDLVMFYRLDCEPEAQDVMVYEFNGDRFIGRVVAIPGDTVEVTEDGRLIINNSTMIETNIFYNTLRFDSNVQYPLTLGEGEYFILGDNRADAMDSRYMGPIRQDDIVGTVISILRRNHI